MWSSVGTVLLVLLAAAGLVEIIRSIIFFFLSEKDESGFIMIVPVYGHDEEAEYLLRSAAVKTKWISGMKKRRVICLDCGMDAETRAVCERICALYSFMEFFSPEEFGIMLLKSAANR